MPRNYTRKSERGIAKPDEMLRAVRHIKSIGKSIRKTDESSFGINYKTLSRYTKNFLAKKLKEKIHLQQQLWGTQETGTCLQMHKK